MNVIAAKQNGCIYLCEFRNDFEKINDILSKSSLKLTIDGLFERYNRDLMSETWNARMNLIIQALETAGCEILWD